MSTALKCNFLFGRSSSTGKAFEPVSTVYRITDQHGKEKFSFHIRGWEAWFLDHELNMGFDIQREYFSGMWYYKNYPGQIFLEIPPSNKFPCFPGWFKCRMYARKKGLQEPDAAVHEAILYADGVPVLILVNEKNLPGIWFPV
jgi:hypothetical protein